MTRLVFVTVYTMVGLGKIPWLYLARRHGCFFPHAATTDGAPTGDGHQHYIYTAGEISESTWATMDEEKVYKARDHANGDVHRMASKQGASTAHTQALLAEYLHVVIIMFAILKCCHLYRYPFILRLTARNIGNITSDRDPSQGCLLTELDEVRCAAMAADGVRARKLPRFRASLDSRAQGCRER